MLQLTIYFLKFLLSDINPNYPIDSYLANMETIIYVSVTSIISIIDIISTGF